MSSGHRNCIRNQTRNKDSNDIDDFLNDAIHRLIKSIKSTEHFASSKEQRHQKQHCVDLAYRILNSNLSYQQRVGNNGSVSSGDRNLGSNGMRDNEKVPTSTWYRRIQRQHENDGKNDDMKKIMSLHDRLMLICQKLQGYDDHECNYIDRGISSLTSSLTRSLPPNFTNDILHVLSKLMKKKECNKDYYNQNRRNATKAPSSIMMPIQKDKEMAYSTKCIVNNEDTDDHHLVFSQKYQYEENQILRELFYIIQGIDGQRIQLMNSNHNNRIIDGKINLQKNSTNGKVLIQSSALATSIILKRIEKSRLGTGAEHAISLCSEAGHFYQRIQYYVQHILCLSRDAGEETSAPILSPNLRQAQHKQQSTHLLFNHIDDHFKPKYQHSNIQQQQYTSLYTAGLVARAFASTLLQQLHHYHQFLTTQFEPNLDKYTLRRFMIELRSPMNRLEKLAMITDAVSGNAFSTNKTDRKSNNVIEKFNFLKGSDILSTLYLHSNHGDVKHQSLLQSLLYKASRPWFNLLYLWTTQGILSDPFHEFFVVDNIHDKNTYQTSYHNKNNIKYMWQNGYRIDYDRIPYGIMDPSLVQPAFVVGKGINFIRKCLQDDTWTMMDSLLNEEPDNNTDSNHGNCSSINISGPDSDLSMQMQLGYHYIPLLQQHQQQYILRQTLEVAADLVHTRILQSLEVEHSMMMHLFALKQFLLHGQGDFFATLMDGLYSVFGGQINKSNKSSDHANEYNVFNTTVFSSGIHHKHTIIAIMENALRTTNAQDLPSFVVQRLRVQLIDNNDDCDFDENDTGAFSDDSNIGNKDENHTVWDIFMLDYEVPDPLVAIIHESAMEQYKLIFNFLFKLRKVEFMLNYTWRQSATLQHAIQKAAQYNGIEIKDNIEYAQATILLRKVAMTRQSMMHFVTNMKSYFMFEVIEGGWKKLCKMIHTSKTLDETILAHNQYLESICRKSLLKYNSSSSNNKDDDISSAHVSSKHTNNNRNNSNKNDKKLRNDQKKQHIFSTTLNIASAFCKLQEQLFDESLILADRAAEKRCEAEERLKEGQWGFNNETEVIEEMSFFGLADRSKLLNVIALSEAFSKCMVTLLQTLDNIVHGFDNCNDNSLSLDGLNQNIIDNKNRRNVDNHNNDESNVSSNNDKPESIHSTVDSKYNAISYQINEQDDLDSLRFLTFQLDHNDYYGVLQYR